MQNCFTFNVVTKTNGKWYGKLIGIQCAFGDKMIGDEDGNDGHRDEDIALAVMIMMVLKIWRYGHNDVEDPDDDDDARVKDGGDNDDDVDNAENDDSWMVIKWLPNRKRFLIP